MNGTKIQWNFRQLCLDQKLQQLSTELLLDNKMLTRKSKKKTTSSINKNPSTSQCCWYTEYKYNLKKTQLISFDKYGR